MRGQRSQIAWQAATLSLIVLMVLDGIRTPMANALSVVICETSV